MFSFVVCDVKAMRKRKIERKKHQNKTKQTWRDPYIVTDKIWIFMNFRFVSSAWYFRLLMLFIVIGDSQFRCDGYTNHDILHNSPKYEAQRCFQFTYVIAIAVNLYILILL